MKPDETLHDASVADITIYSVGLLNDLTHFVHNPDRAAARQQLRYALRYPFEQAKIRNWRAVRNYFNGYLAEGYLAEHEHLGTRAGHGWTRGRAYRNLARHLHSDPRDHA